MWRRADGCESLFGMKSVLKGASEEGQDLGFGFWAKTAGGLLVVGIACFILLILFTRAIYAWGALAAFGLLVAGVLVFVWYEDRKQVEQYEKTINS